MKKGSGLRECIGILKRDKEWEELEKEIKRVWRNWSRKHYTLNKKQLFL